MLCDEFRSRDSHCRSAQSDHRRDGTTSHQSTGNKNYQDCGFGQASRSRSDSAVEWGQDAGRETARDRQNDSLPQAEGICRNSVILRDSGTVPLLEHIVSPVSRPFFLRLPKGPVNNSRPTTEGGACEPTHLRSPTPPSTTRRRAVSPA